MKSLFTSSRHLSEERLFGCYLAERSGEGIDPPTAEHLAECAECHRQYAELVAFMDETWMDGELETAALFTPDRLAVQQQQIARRLELVGQAGRVLSFRSVAEPDAAGQLGSAHVIPPSAISRAAAGWMVAAALVIGVGAGMLFDAPPAVAPPPGGAAVTQPVAPAPAAPARADLPSSPVDDPSFMDDLEAVLDRPRTPELYAFDALTPHVREAVYRR